MNELFQELKFQLSTAILTILTLAAAISAGINFEQHFEKELAALQGTWVPLHYEERGEKGNAEFTRHIIKGDKVTVQVDGRTQDEGRVVLDPTQNPKQLYLRMNSGPTHAIIYVRAGNHVIYCGNRRQEPLPREFVSGTAEGGEYLIAWRIER
jgi:uncharacterized protein (TIGR03067 family)